MVDVNDYQYRKIGVANFLSIDGGGGLLSTGMNTGNYSSITSKYCSSNGR